GDRRDQRVVGHRRRGGARPRFRRRARREPAPRERHVAVRDRPDRVRERGRLRAERPDRLGARRPLLGHRDARRDGRRAGDDARLGAQLAAAVRGVLAVRGGQAARAQWGVAGGGLARPRPSPGPSGHNRRGCAWLVRGFPERPAGDRRRPGADARHDLPVRRAAKGRPRHQHHLHRADRDIGCLYPLPTRQRAAWRRRPAGTVLRRRRHPRRLGCPARPRAAAAGWVRAVPALRLSAHAGAEPRHAFLASGRPRRMSWEAPAEMAERARVDARWAAARRLVRRSILIVPTNVPRFVEKAHLRDADAVMLDLEDSIPASEKAAARGMLGDAVGKVGRGGADVLVRINKPYELAMADVDAAVRPGVAAIAFPKTESAREVALLDAAIGRREAAQGMPVGAVRLVVMIETARGLRAVDEILATSDRIVGVDLGSEDFTRDLEVEPTPSGHELLVARQLVVAAARRAGVQAHGMATTLANYTDVDALRDSIRRAREMGFRGAGCIHPAQVPLLNEG